MSAAHSPSNEELNAETAARVAASPDDPRTWWTHGGLDVREGRLRVAGRDAEALAHEHGTPLYVYDVCHVTEQISRLQAALSRAGLAYRTRFALKAQRAPEILAAVRALGPPGDPDSVGMDVCSPAELEHALACGWQPDEISYTGTNVSERDLDVILAHGPRLNVDSLSQLERLGRRAPGLALGLRINPRAGAAHQYVVAGRSPGDMPGFGVYSGARPTKFGVYPEQLDEALAIARKHRLTINTVHFHLAHQLLNEDLPNYDHALGEAAAMVRHLLHAGCPVTEVNTGGGLGMPLSWETGLSIWRRGQACWPSIWARSTSWWAPSRARSSPDTPAWSSPRRSPLRSAWGPRS